MTTIYEIAKINPDRTREQIAYLPNADQQRVHTRLLAVETALYNNLMVEFDGKRKIEKIESKIISVDGQMKGRTIGKRIGYGVACLATALLLCPVSWVAGIVASLFLAFAGGGAIGMAFPLFVKPAKLCGKLFKLAFYRAASWEIEKGESKQQLLARKEELKKFRAQAIEPLRRELSQSVEAIAIPSLKQEIKDILSIDR